MSLARERLERPRWIRRPLVVIVTFSLLILAVPGIAATMMETARDRLAAADRGNSGNSFSFVVFSDTHIGQNLRRKVGATSLDPQPQPAMVRVVAETSLLKPAFAIGAGDLVDGDTSNLATLNKEWDKYQEVTGTCSVPIFPVPGNHDLSEGATSRAVWKERLGPTYYSFSFRNSHFIILDTLENMGKPQLSDEQMSWLENDLETHRDSQNIFLIMHQPIFIEVDYPDAQWGKVHELLTKYPVRAVYAGHYHNYSLEAVRDGIRYVVTSAAGGDVSGNADLGEYPTYLLVTVDGDSASHIVIRPGSIEPPDVVTGESRQQYNELSKRVSVARPAVAYAGRPLDDTAELVIENPRATSSEAIVRWQANSSGIAITPEESKLMLAPNGKTNVSLKITGMLSPELSKANQPRLSILLPYPTGGRTAELTYDLPSLLGKAEVPRAVVPPTIDGNLSEWSAVPAYPILALDAASSDLTPLVRFMWDDTYFYLAAEVQDDVHHAVAPDKNGGGDALWISGLVNWSRVALLDDGHIIVQDWSAKPTKDLTSVVSASVTYEAGMTRYEMRWPRSLMPQPSLEKGKPFRIDVFCSDRDDNLPESNCPKRCVHQVFYLDARP